MKTLSSSRPAPSPVELDPQGEAIIATLTALRQRRGLSCCQIARVAKIPVSTVGRLERRRHVPTFNVLARYCRACGGRLTVAVEG